MKIKILDFEIHLDMSKHIVCAISDSICIKYKDAPEKTVTFKGIPHATQVVVDLLDKAYAESES